MAKTIDSSAKDLINASPKEWAKLSHLVSDSDDVKLVDADTSTIVGSSDKVAEVKEGESTRYLIMEFQAQFDELLLPSCVLREDVLRRNKGEIIADTVIFFTHQAALPKDKVLGEYLKKRHSGKPSLFRYTAVKLWELDPDVILAMDARMSPLATLTKTTKGKFPKLVERIEQKIATLPSQQEQNQFWTIAYHIAGVKWKDKAFLDKLFQGKFKMMDSVTYQGTLEEGKIELGREIILETLKELFGEVPEQIAQQVQALNDLEKIKNIRRASMKAESLEEIAALLE